MGTDPIFPPDHDLVVVWRRHAGSPAEFTRRVIAAIKPAQQR